MKVGLAWGLTMEQDNDSLGDGFDGAEMHGYASPACMAHELADDWLTLDAVDPVQARDVARWRRAERDRLRAARQGLPAAARRGAARRLDDLLRDFLAERAGAAGGRVLAAYWPILGEPDLRPLMAHWHEGRGIVALPVVSRRGAPLVFRAWSPATRLVPGVWHIPVPPEDAQEVVPDIVLAPLLGWDPAGYRLGNGGGYYDRTLAALMPRPLTIGVGLAAARLATIFPQPHDIPLDAIVTEEGVVVAPEGGATRR